MSDDERTQANLRPYDSERPSDSLTRPNFPSPDALPAPKAMTLEEALTFDDETEIAKGAPPVKVAPLPSEEESLQFSFSVPLGPNDTIIPTIPRGNVSAYDALVRSTKTEKEEVSIADFPDPDEFDVPDDTATLDRAPVSKGKEKPKEKKTRKLPAFDVEATQSLSGEDLEVLDGQAITSDSMTAILPERRAPASSPQPPPPLPPPPSSRRAPSGPASTGSSPSSKSGISVEIPAEPAYELDDAEDPYTVDDGVATLVPSKARYAQLISEIAKRDSQAEAEDPPTEDGSLSLHDARTQHREPEDAPTQHREPEDAPTQHREPEDAPTEYRAPETQLSAEDEEAHARPTAPPPPPAPLPPPVPPPTMHAAHYAPETVFDDRPEDSTEAEMIEELETSERGIEGQIEENTQTEIEGQFENDLGEEAPTRSDHQKSSVEIEVASAEISIADVEEDSSTNALDLPVDSEGEMPTLASGGSTSPPPPAPVARARRGSMPSSGSIDGVMSGPMSEPFIDEPIESQPFSDPIESDETSTLPGRGKLDAKASAAPAPIRTKVYRPPPLGENRVGAVQVATFEVDQDAEERVYTKDQSWEALIELYLSRIQRAPSWGAKAKLFAKIASVFEVKLGDSEQALDALMEAFELSPTDEGVAKGIERLAGPLGKWREIVERAKGKLANPVPEGRMALIARVAHWHDVGLNRRDLAHPYLEQLAKLDPNHPLLLRRNAATYREQGNPQKEKDALERMLDAANKPEEKVEILMMLALVPGTTLPDALGYYERAYSIDPKNAAVLSAIEKNGESQEHYGQVEWAIRQQIAECRSNDERVRHHMRIASYFERRMLKRDSAAREFEMVLAIDPRNHDALTGLERCYRATQNWPDLARTLERRADVAADAGQRVALLVVAAEVWELKTQDTRNAIKCLKRVLGIDNAHKESIELLAKLSQKVDEYGDVARYRVRLAELEPTPRARAGRYAQLAEILASAGKDEMGAQRYWQLAVDTDPQNAAAWEALTRAARSSGDQTKLARVLEQRAEHTVTPRVRAQVLVELAETRRGLSDEPGVAAAYEAAVQADKTNEDAAAYMLDRYVREAKWKQAAPLCELLVNAAVRDQETTMLIGRLRLSTRIAASQGDVQKAIAAAVSAYDARPDDPGGRSDLLDLCLQLRAFPQRIAKASAAVERIAMRLTELSPPELGKLGQVLLLLGQTDEAIEVCARALAADPQNRDATAALADAYLARGDWAGASDCKVSLARTAKTDEERFKRLVEAGEVWAQKAKEPAQARELWEKALEINPRDRTLLHALMKLYGEMEMWDRLTSVLFSLAEMNEGGGARAKTLFIAAQVYAEKIGDLERAAEVYDQVLDTDRTRLDAFEQIVRLYTMRKDWGSLERSYRKMLARIKDLNDKNLAFNLWKQLGVIYRDRLGEVEKARESLRQADLLRPTDGDVRRMLTELDVVTDNIDNAINRCRSKMRENPHDAELYSEIYDLFLRKHAFDSAWCAVNVLAQFRELSGQAAQFYIDYPPFHLSNVPGQITEEAWRTHVLHEGLDNVLTRIFAVMTPLVARARALTPGAQELARQAQQLGPQHTQIANSLYRAFRDACEILSLTPPELLAAQGSSTAPPFVSAIIPYGGIWVSGQAIETQADSLAFLVGKRLSEQRAELMARAFFPTVTELRALLAAAVRIARGGAAKDAASQGFDAQVAAVLSREEADWIRRLVIEASEAGSLLDVKRWSQCADLSSTRAGLLLCGDVTQARRAIQREQQSSTDLAPREKIGEVYLFATSDEYADLRGAIGVAVGTE